MDHIDKPDEKKLINDHSGSAPYPKLDTEDVVSPSSDETSFVMERESQPKPNELLRTKSPTKSVTWSSELTTEAPPEYSATESTNPYVSASSPPPQSVSLTVKNTVSTMKQVIWKWGKKVGETTKRSQDLAGNAWQHMKTAPSLADAAMGRIAQGTKVLAEGGYEKIFQQTFETVPEEQLQETYACYLSTSAGPVMGILYISTAKLAFCSDNPLPYKVEEQNEWSYYKARNPDATGLLAHSWRITCRSDLKKLSFGTWWSSHYISLKQLIHQLAKLTGLKSTFRLHWKLANLQLGVCYTLSIYWIHYREVDLMINRAEARGSESCSALYCSLPVYLFVSSLIFSEF